MSAGPMIPRRVAQPVEQMLENTDGYLDIDKAIEAIGGMRAKAEYKPDDEVALWFYQTYLDAKGRKVIEWLLDLTARAPIPMMEKGFEHAALMAAKAQAREGIGNVIAEAICLGEKIFKQKQGTDQ
ncbi:MAG: hypothetical protein U5K75_00050 [Ahrensia sp.]|nr:hypothetical protein [Ahrensia sp.]